MQDDISSTIFDNAALGIVVANHEHRITDINRAGALMLGYTPAELVGKLIAEISDPDYMEPNRTYFEELKAGTRNSYQMTKRYTRKDGGIFWGKISVSLLSGRDEPVRILGIMENITEQKTAEDALRESEERFRQVLISMYDWVWEVDENACYTFASENVENILGYKPEEMLGKTPFDFMPPEEATRVGIEFGKIAVNHQPFRYLENMNLHKNGSPVLLETSGVPLFDALGKFCGYRGVDRDITEHKKLQSELVQSKKMQALGELTGGIAHDFNNILHIMLGNLHLVREDLENPEENRTLLDHALKTGEQAKRLIDKLLAFSRKQTLAPQIVRLEEVIKQTVKAVSGSLGDNIQLEVKIAEDLPPVFVDRAGLESAVVNLILNSRDAMPAGGMIRLTISRCTDNNVLICLEDWGSGISEEHIEQVVEPFFTTKQIGDGSGLGLSTTYGFVKQSGGDLKIHSAVGEGTKIIMQIPLAKGNSD